MNGLPLNDITIVTQLDFEIQPFQRAESVLVPDSEHCTVDREAYILVCAPDLGQLGSIVALGSYDTVRAEVPLMWAGEVIARVQLPDTLLQFVRFVYSLIHPVPDTASDSGIALLHGLHVLGQVTNGISHGMGILAQEHRLVQITCIPGHPVHTGIHLAVEIAVCTASVILVDTRSLVMNGTGRIHSSCYIIAVLEIASCACLVTH